MSMHRSRDQFKAYCLRRLGAGVHKINVTDLQVEDRIDDALSFWRDYHYNATERTYFKHIVTQENKDAGYIEIPETIHEITRILETTSIFSGSSSFTSPIYQFMLNELWTLTSYQMAPYVMMRMGLEGIKEAIRK